MGNVIAAEMFDYDTKLVWGKDIDDALGDEQKKTEDCSELKELGV